MLNYNPVQYNLGHNVTTHEFHTIFLFNKPNER
jgi:hypothetical protein